MKNKQVNVYLTMAILTLTVLPLLASYWLLDEVLNGAIGLAVKPENQQLLEHYREDLKTLKELDPQNEAQYKARFLQASDELLIYQQPDVLHQVLRDTWLTYFLLLFVAVLLCSLIAAVWLSQRVASSYKRLVARDIKKAQKLRELSYFDEWQTIASKLAHEINNPLTPIEMMVSNLHRIHGHAGTEVFKQSLEDTQVMVSEEVQKLKEMVSHFSQFSKLPEPKIKQTDLAGYCEDFIGHYQHAWPQVRFAKTNINPTGTAYVLLDNLLFNQCLINLINNAVQANQKLESIDISLTLKTEIEDAISLLVFNNGKTIPAEECERIFQMYYSSKSADENMGLGLSIVKKIVLDHGGEIVCLPVSDGALFKITLPTYSVSRKHDRAI